MTSDPAGGTEHSGANAILWFGPFAFETAKNRLCRDGTEVHLTPKAAAVLHHLLQRPGELITKDEFLEVVWPDVHVREESLTQAISAIRHALGDSPQRPQCIQTISGEGYRFIGKLSIGTEHGAGSGAADSATIAPAAGTPALAATDGTSDEPAHEAPDRVSGSPTRGGRPAPAGESQKSPLANGVRAVVASVITMTAIVALASFLRPVPSEPAVDPEFAIVTSYTGYESYPALSPDGRQVAFMWDEGVGPRLFVQFVSGGGPVALAAARYGDPAWDPTGERIAYMRDREPSSERGDRRGLELRTISPLGTDDRRMTVTSSTESGLDWSPDGRFLAFSDRAAAPERPSIFFLSLATGTTHQVTFRPEGEASLDRRPAFSPDGRHLAFVRQRAGAGGLGEIYVQRLDAEGTPAGEAQLLASPYGFVHDVDWTPDGAVVYSGGPSDDNLYLTLLPVDGSESSRLSVGDRARDFSIVGNRLVYSQRQDDIDLWRVGGPTADQLGVPERWGSSTRDDHFPHYSPDGTRVTFISGRSGAWGVWVADADGRNTRQLSDLGHASRPRWAPDGRLIAFTAMPPGRPTDVWVVDPEGGPPRNLTDDDHPDSIPGWSADGESIYFQSLRRGGVAPWEIWKMDRDGAGLTQITDGGDFRPLHHGQRLYVARFGPEWRGGRIASLPDAGGEVVVLLDHAVDVSGWDLWRGNVVFIERGEPGTAVIRIFDPETGELREHAVLPVPGSEWVRPEGTLTVSPDGQFILYSAKSRPGGADLLLVDGFH